MSTKTEKDIPIIADVPLKQIRVIIKEHHSYTQVDYKVEENPTEYGNIKSYMWKYLPDIEINDLDSPTRKTVVYAYMYELPDGRTKYQYCIQENWMKFAIVSDWVNSDKLLTYLADCSLKT